MIKLNKRRLNYKVFANTENGIHKRNDFICEFHNRHIEELKREWQRMETVGDFTVVWYWEYIC